MKIGEIFLILFFLLIIGGVIFFAGYDLFMSNKVSNNECMQELAKEICEKEGLNYEDIGKGIVRCNPYNREVHWKQLITFYFTPEDRERCGI